MKHFKSVYQTFLNQIVNIWISLGNVYGCKGIVIVDLLWGSLNGIVRLPNLKTGAFYQRYCRDGHLSSLEIVETEDLLHIHPAKQTSHVCRHHSYIICEAKTYRHRRITFIKHA